MNAKRTRGFSLVELVIVIVILGVIAAIAVPRISRGARGADESAVRQNLAILRTAVEMYSAEHGGTFPGDDGSESTLQSQLLQYTNKQGEPSTTKVDDHIYGPYLRKQIPPLPIGKQAGNNGVNLVTAAPAADQDGDYGWVYNYQTGEIIANAPNATESDPNVNYDEW